MKSREHNSLPEEILQEFQNGTSDSRQKAIRVWDLLENAKQDPLSVPSTEQALGELEAMIGEKRLDKVHADDRRPLKRQKRITIKKSIFSSIAVCCAVLIGIMSYLSVPVTYTTHAGEKMSLMLPDGSEVQLNTESSIQYKRSFRHWYGLKTSARMVELEGEAFLTVAKDGRLFVVNTFNAEVTVLGTGFNVRAYSSDPSEETRVTLDHGSVQVELLSQNDQEGVVLTDKGQEVVVKNDALKKSDSDKEGNMLEWATAWRSDGFVGMGLSIESLESHIERHYATDIRISEGLHLEPVDLIYPKKTPAIEQILSDLCISAGCSFQQTASGYLLLPAE